MFNLRAVKAALVCNLVLVTSALAGSSGSPPAGDQGAGASEPSSFALIMLCALPGVWLINRALKSSQAED
ncbi:MAG: hypothetical protein ACPGQS_08245 [Bradymonadia bacterium]